MPPLVRSRLEYGIRLVAKTGDIASGLIGLGGVAAAAYLVISVRLRNGELTSPLIYAACFLAGMVLASIANLVWRRRKARTSWVQRGYTILQHEYVYEVDADDPRRHRCTTRQRIKTLQSGVELVDDRYIWSGSGHDSGRAAVSAGHVALRPPLPGDLGWKHILVHVGRRLPRGSVEEVCLTQSLFDEDRHFLCHLTKTISVPTRELHLVVELPKRLEPDFVHLQVYGKDGGPHAKLLKETNGHWDPQKERIEWKVEHPRVGLRYQIRWGYRDRHGLYREDDTAPGTADATSTPA